MQIILLEKVANLGNLGDVVKVKDGFARNFLIPRQPVNHERLRVPRRMQQLNQLVQAACRASRLKDSVKARPSLPTTIPRNRSQNLLRHRLAQ